RPAPAVAPGAHGCRRGGHGGHDAGSASIHAGRAGTRSAAEARAPGRGDRRGPGGGERRRRLLPLDGVDSPHRSGGSSDRRRLVVPALHPEGPGADRSPRADGGRQLDRCPASLDVLEEVVTAVGGLLEVYLDGGVRRGGDVVIALALGARGVFIGRPYLYALAAGGEDGVRRALELLSVEMRN